MRMCVHMLLAGFCWNFSIIWYGRMVVCGFVIHVLWSLRTDCAASAGPVGPLCISLVLGWPSEFLLGFWHASPEKRRHRRLNGLFRARGGHAGHLPSRKFYSIRERTPFTRHFARRAGSPSPFEKLNSTQLNSRKVAKTGSKYSNDSKKIKIRDFLTRVNPYR